MSNNKQNNKKEGWLLFIGLCIVSSIAGGIQKLVPGISDDKAMIFAIALIFIIICIIAVLIVFLRSKLSASRNRVIYNAPAGINGMTGWQFENYCATLLQNGGFYNVQVTQQSGDYGADIIAVDYYGNVWAIQCKRYQGALGLKPIQEVLGSMKMYNANRAAVITNSRFTSAAKKLAQKNGVSLIDGKRISRSNVITYNDLSVYDLL